MDRLGDDGNVVLPVRVEVGDVMLAARLREHANDDPVKPTEFWTPESYMRRPRWRNLIRPTGEPTRLVAACRIGKCNCRGIATDGPVHTSSTLQRRHHSVSGMYSRTRADRRLRYFCFGFRRSLSNASFA